MEENKNYDKDQQMGRPEEDELQIDWMALALKAWSSRKWILKVTLLAALVGVVFAFCKTRQYAVSVTLAPEITNGKGNSSLSGLASMMGLGGMSAGSGTDALGVALYPDIVASTPFLIDLFDIQIQDSKAEVDTTLYGYMTEKKGFSIMALPGMAIGAIKSLFSSEEAEETKGLNPFHLTKEQAGVVKALRAAIVADVDKKTGVTTVNVTWKDPLIAATLADSVCALLQEHITTYRVQKAKEDLAYYQKLTAENRENYMKAQQALARYQDSNRGLVLQSVRSEETRLENEMSLAFQVYNQMAQQQEMAKAKVQEAKPVFAVVEPATVPLQPAGTSRKMVVLGFIFLGFCGATAWVLFGKDSYSLLRTKLREING